MSYGHNPYPHPTQGAGFRPRESNGMGVAGLIVSILGLLLTCGLLCPVGLLLSMIGLTKQPRGEAIAGTIIGGFGTLAVVTVGGFIWLTMATAATAFRHLEEEVKTEQAIVAAEAEIEDYRFEHGELPGGIEGNKLILDHTDAWGNSLRFDLADDAQSYDIRSAGRDLEFDTRDDITQDDRYGGKIAVDVEPEIDYGIEEGEELDFDLETTP